MQNIVTAYEVIRIINFKPLFVKDHFQRLKNSVVYIDSKIIVNEEDFLNQITKLVQQNKIENGNIKVLFEINVDTGDVKMTYMQIPHHYPTDDDYRNGIETVTYKFVRDNPHSKIWNQSLREITDNLIADKKVFEVLYINANNCLTEGSRSNLFFINGNDLISAPSSDILLGITRKFIIETAKLCGLNLVEREIKLNEITSFDCAFISGTSPKILPIRSIDGTKFNVSNSFLRKLMNDFDKLIEANINSYNSSIR